MPFGWNHTEKQCFLLRYNRVNSMSLGNVLFNYRLTSSDARPHLMHDFTKSSITNNFFYIDSINIILALLEFYNLNNLIYIIKIKIFIIYN